MGRDRVQEILGLFDLADLAYINLDKPNSRRGTLQFGKPPLPEWNAGILRVKGYFRD